MKNLISILGLVLAAGFLSSCNKGNNDSSVGGGACAYGSTYVNGGCYNNGGYVGVANYQYNSTGFYADNYSGTSSLRVVNGSKMREFFKLAMGVCDRAAANYGQASCDSYIGGSMDMIIQLPPTGANSLLVTIIAKPKYNQYYNYSAQLPSGYGLLGLALGMTTGVYIPDPKQYFGAVRNPLRLEMAVSAINNSTGFSANGYGDYNTGYNRTKLTIEVPQGKVESSTLNFIFKVQDVPAAQGTFTRCRTLNCGI